MEDSNMTVSVNDDELTRILRSGRPPFTIEASDIANTIENLEASVEEQEERILKEISREEERVRKHEEKMAQLKISLLALKEKRQRYQSALSPIRKLHSELLSLIFVTYLDLFTRGNRFGRNKASSCCGFLPLALVCAHWYSVILETPRLWGTISIDLSLRERLGALTPAIMRHLALSKKALLYLDLDWDSFPMRAKTASPARESGDKFLEILAGEQARWRRVRLHAGLLRFYQDDDTDVQNKFLRELLKPEFPELESLEMQGTGYYADIKNPFMQNCPKLHRLSLSNYSPSGLLDFPWHQITYLSLRNLDVTVVVEALGLCPNLVSVELVIVWRPRTPANGNEVPESNNSNLSLGSLQNLSITMDRTQYLYWSSLRWFLESLTCPSLQTLHLVGVGIRRNDLYGTHPDNAWPDQTLLDFFIRSQLFPTLRILSITNLPVRESNLLDLLAHTPMLADLTIHDLMQRVDNKRRYHSSLHSAGYDDYCSEEDDDFEKLGGFTIGKMFLERLTAAREVDHASSPQGQLTPLLPHLRRIELRLYPFDVQELIWKMARSRWDTGSAGTLPLPVAVEQLESIAIKFIAQGGKWKRSWFEDESVLYELRGEGMAVKVGWESDLEGSDRGEVLVALKDENEEEEED
ncbi:hypothetical protein D9758_013624 [Tetrapyrgos nigripes]|uniref:F-box domain-containing protein n=1 Tax=Tetrapyrgos nigripes TaxID=182062 RepID=A0A8H5CPC9_9AGAR|nr:hypothetical protein D9758_013624 [Tetrapyrgos nigripes]